MGNFIFTKWDVIDHKWTYGNTRSIERVKTPPTVFILQYETREDRRQMCSHMLKTNEEYAKRHGYEYRLLTDTQWDATMPPYWVKVFAMESFLRKYDYVVWVDSDAVISDHTKRVDGFFTDADGEDDPNVKFVGCEDPPWYFSFFMAGIFMVRGNDDTIRRLFEDWTSGYASGKWWKTEKGAWRTYGFWAGPNYEQGYFVRHVYSAYRPGIRLLPYRWFHEFDLAAKAGLFAFHFCAKHRANIPLFGTDNVRSIAAP